jgi:hypothetical protein
VTVVGFVKVVVSIFVSVVLTSLGNAWLPIIPPTIIPATPAALEDKKTLLETLDDFSEFSLLSLLMIQFCSIHNLRLNRGEYIL